MEAKMVLLWLVASTTLWLNTATSRSHFQPLLASVVNKTGGARQARIIGPNGYCLDVKGDDYGVLNDIILWPCKEKYEDNQLWTFESDGTIRSKGMCLSANLSLKSVFLLQCRRPHPLRNSVWEMRDDGLIVEVTDPTITKRVLTASSGEAGAELTVQSITFSSLQTWRFDDLGWRKNWGFISGLRGRCLEILGSDTISVDSCSNFSNRKLWNFFPDGTIRPAQSLSLCIGYDDDSKTNPRRVSVIRCGQYPTNERWWHTSDGTILNEKDNLVLEMVDSRLIVASPPTGIPEQQWVYKRVAPSELF